MRYRIENQDGRHIATLTAPDGDLIAMRDAFANMFADPMGACIRRGSITRQEDSKTRIVPRDREGRLLVNRGTLVFYIAIPQHDGHGT